MSDIYKLDFELPLKDIQDRIDSLKKNSINSGVDVSSTIKKLEDELIEKRDNIYQNLSRWYLDIAEREAVVKGYAFMDKEAKIPKL